MSTTGSFNHTALHLLPSYRIHQRCREETTRFRQGEEHDTSFCHELLRRALLKREAAAWEAVYQHYRLQVIAWIKQSLARAWEVSETEMESLVHDSLLKWSGTFHRHPEKFADYPSLASLLGILRRSVQFVVRDYVAAQKQATGELSIDETEEAIQAADATANRIDEYDLWKTLNQLLQNEQERLIVTYLLILEHKPRHLYEEHPDKFQNVDEINTIRERVMARLRRNRQFYEFLRIASEKTG